jgi:hypothetical protein
LKKVHWIHANNLVRKRGLVNSYANGIVAGFQARFFIRGNVRKNAQSRLITIDNNQLSNMPEHLTFALV